MAQTNTSFTRSQGRDGRPDRGGVYLLVAGGLALSGRSKVQAATPPIPEQTAESVKEDLESTKEKAKERRA